MNFSEMTNEQLEQKREFGEKAGGAHGIYVVRECTIELNRRALKE